MFFADFDREAQALPLTGSSDELLSTALKDITRNGLRLNARARYHAAMLRLAALAVAAGLLAGPTQSLAPYVPTPPEVVDRMLGLADVTRADVVYDLGCGDGRIPIAAAKKYGARGVGLDIDPKRIEEARLNARQAGVEHLVEFRVEDVMKADVSDATVVTLYLLTSSNVKLRPILTRQLRAGARVVSHAFSMGPEWPADKIDRFTTRTGDEITLYLWKVDGRARQAPAASASGEVRERELAGVGPREH
jgi:SAM-dependent methyltransferase